MIEVNNLHKYYGSDKERIEVLKGISFVLPDSKIMCVLGPSGSGKSTLLNILGGIEKIDEGSVNIYGNRLESMKKKELESYRRRYLGFIFQF